MGRSVTCTYSVRVQGDTSEYIYGAMNMKEALGCIKSEIEYRGIKNVFGANIWPQTQAGRNVVGDFDYIHMDNQGNKTKKRIN
ncbi:MAG: hypothetical protein IT245_06830 [Bacteroidia bacterium]|nr:hypothetical protein [Bacteroidia bacterium]